MSIVISQSTQAIISTTLEMGEALTISDGYSVSEGCSAIITALLSSHQVTLEPTRQLVSKSHETDSLHDTGDTLLSSCDLSSNVGSDLGLVQVVL